MNRVDLELYLSNARRAASMARAAENAIDTALRTARDATTLAYEAVQALEAAIAREEKRP